MFNKKVIRLFSLTLLTAAIAFFVNTDFAAAQAIDNPSSFHPQTILRNALLWIDSLGTVGAIAFIALYIIATVAFLPGSILTLGAGVVWGSLSVFIGATAVI